METSYNPGQSILNKMKYFSKTGQEIEVWYLFVRIF